MIETLALSHIFINSQVSLPFTPILSEFCLGHLDELINCVFDCAIDKAEELKNYLFRVGIVAGTLGGFNSETWAKGILKLLQIPSKNHEIIHCYISPAHKFVKVEAKDQ